MVEPPAHCPLHPIRPHTPRWLSQALTPDSLPLTHHLHSHPPPQTTRTLIPINVLDFRAFDVPKRLQTPPPETPTRCVEPGVPVDVLDAGGRLGKVGGEEGLEVVAGQRLAVILLR